MVDGNRAYLVARVGWRVRPRGNGHTHFYRDYLNTSDPEDRRFVPVAAFPHRSAAEAKVRELELEAARLFNPFWMICPTDSLTSLPPPQFIGKLAELVGPLPLQTISNDNRRPWREWWGEHAPSWPDGALAKVWELFDRVRFYAILEVEAE